MADSRRCGLPNRILGRWRQVAVVLACVALIAGAAKASLAQDSLAVNPVRLLLFPSVPPDVIVLNLPDVRYPAPGPNSIFPEQRRIGPTRLLWGDGGVIRIGANFAIRVDRLDWWKHGRSRVTITPANGAFGFGLIHKNVFARKIRLDQPLQERLSAKGMGDRITFEFPAGEYLEMKSRSYPLDVGPAVYDSTRSTRRRSAPIQWGWGNGYLLDVGEGYDIGEDRLDFWSGRTQITFTATDKWRQQFPPSGVTCGFLLTYAGQ